MGSVIVLDPDEIAVWVGSPELEVVECSGHLSSASWLIGSRSLFDADDEK